MKSKSLCYAASVALALGVVHNASAQDDHWGGTPGNTLWNVATNWSLGIVPPNDATAGYGPDFTGNVWLDPTNGDSVITIPPGVEETPGVPLNGEENYNTIFGPEFGLTLNIYGSLTYDWTMAPYSPDPSQRSTINMFTNSVMTTSGASINLGDAWWSGPQFGCHDTMNLYGNAQFSSTGGAGMWFGAHLNIYDTATFLVNGYVNMDVAYGESDGTRSIVMGGGSLILPEGTMTGGGNSGSVDSWIGRGILRAYGKGYDTNDLVVTDNGDNTIVTNVPLGGVLEQVYFEPLLLTNVNVGTVQQATLVGDYPAVTGVLLSSAEPGLDPAQFPHPIYASSDANVATVDTNGVVTAVGAGSATLTAVVGTFTATNSLAITVSPIVPALAHRYSFKDASGSTTAADSVGGSAWNGTLNGDAVLSGTNLVLSGNVGSCVILPAGILTGVNVVTIEAWVTFPSTINPYANLFAFGNTDDTSALSATYGDGENYITFSPHTGATPNTAQANFGQGDPGSAGEWDAVSDQVLDNQTNDQIVVVFNPCAGHESFYLNGLLVVSQTMFNNLTDPVAYVGPTYNQQGILANTLGTDPLNYIGQSLYHSDPGLLANISEFRIYTNALTAAQIAADHALGPNQLIGTNIKTSLSVSTSAGNLILKWPTSSALVTLLSSPALGAGAVWTPVSGALATDGNGNYQMTVTASGSAQYFRLQQ